MKLKRKIPIYSLKDYLWYSRIYLYAMNRFDLARKINKLLK